MTPNWVKCLVVSLCLLGGNANAQGISSGTFQGPMVTISSRTSSIAVYQAGTWTISTASATVISSGTVTAYQGGPWNVGQVGTYTVTPGTGTWPVSGPLTNTELRASSVPVTAFQGGAWTATLANSSFSVSGSTVVAYQGGSWTATVNTATSTVVSNFPATQVVSGTVAVTQATSPWIVNLATSVVVSNFPATQSVTGPLTNAELRASSVPVTSYQGGVWIATTVVSNFPAIQAVSSSSTTANVTAFQGGTWTATVNTATSTVVQQGTTPWAVYSTTGAPVNSYIDSGQSDAFVRIRTGDPISLFESQLQYGLSPLVWNSSVSVSGASIVHLSTASSVQLQVDGTNGAFAIRQTREYFRYQSGKSQLIYVSAVVGSATANVTKDWGYGDRYNGIFFRQTGSGLFAVIRSTTGGTFNERIVAQANFNVDPMNGTGPSGFNIDLSSGNIFWIDFGWLGYNEVRMGVMSDNRMITAHIFKNSNSFAAPYINTPNLPVYYAIRNTAASTGSKLIQGSASVIQEGGSIPFGLSFSTGTGVVEVVVNTRRPIMSIRPANTFKGLENRQRFLPQFVDVTVTNAQSLYYEIVQGGVLTGASFSSIDTESGMEADKSATTITGGVVIEAGYVNSVGTRQSIVSIRSKNPLTVDFDSKNGTNLSIVLTSFSANANTAGSFKWEEFR